MATLGDRPSLLGLNDDVLFQICQEIVNDTTGWPPEPDLASLKAFSSTNSHLRSLAGPSVFRSVHFGVYLDWAKALRSVQTLEKCEAVKLYTEDFFRVMDYVNSVPPTCLLTILPYNQVGLYHVVGERVPSLPVQLPKKLAAVLPTMSNLVKVTLIISVHHIEAFKKAFEATKVVMPSVRTLVLGPHMEWVIDMCPNVTTISTHEWRNINSSVDGLYSNICTNLIEAAGRVSGLQHFELHSQGTDKHLQAILEAMPDIASFAEIGAAGLATCLPILRQFKNLKMLVTAGASFMGVGFDPPWCGNAYHGPGGAALRKKVKEEGHQAERKIAQRIFDACPQLETLWIGYYAKWTVKRGAADEVLDVDCDSGKQRKTPLHSLH